ncbi:MAG: AMP-binding protein [Actinobacteria bacterium]|nr:AMP-binding protein [Actinomycetota bacterium]
MEKNFSRWPKGVARNLDYPEVPAFQILRSAAQQWPERNAIVFAGMEMTFRELDQLSDRFAAALAGLGVGKGDRVALHLVNSPQFAIAYYGLLKAGAVFVPVSPLLSERELVFQLNDAGVETFVGLDLFWAVASQVLPQTGVKRAIEVSLADCYPPLSAPEKQLSKGAFGEGVIDFTALVADHPAEPPEIAFNVKEDLAHISYTGGTTGTPKGIMVTHYNAVVNSCQLSYWFSGGQVQYENGIIGLRREEGDADENHPFRRGREVSLVVPPWFHAMGAFGYLNMQLMAGNTLVVFPRFDPEEFLRAIGKYRATLFGGAPQLFVPMVDHPLYAETDMSGIRLVASGGAPIPLSLMRRLLDKFPGVICEAYGLSEATAIVTITPPERDALKVGSVGLPVADTEVRIADPEDHTREMDLGEVGEVCVRGPQVTKGFWNNPEETALMFKEDGWLLTGDMGRMDEDGYLYIVDRKKDMLIYKGYNVYPRDLEEVLNAHPAVAQSAVVGKKDERYGELPVAFVQLVPGSSVSEAELLEYANSELAAYKKIRALRIVEAVPASQAGKVLRRELRDLAQEMEV